MPPNYRSATFNLGILQGLAQLNLLRCIDYLSTVSGGGYIHQWFAAWGRRRGFEQVERRLIPLPEPGNPGDHPEPVRWLRRYSNYLTPENGLLSADTWVAIATWLRNAILNQIILISGIFFLALLPHVFTSATIIPQRGPAIVATIGAIVCFSLFTIYFLGQNLLRFSRGAAGEAGAFGAKEVQRWLVLPLTVAVLLVALLVPHMVCETFQLDLLILFLASMFMLLTLAVTATLAGGAPLCYLQTQHHTSQYKSVSEFWKKTKCLSHLRFVIALVGMGLVCVVAAAGGAVWIAGAIILLAKLWSVAGALCWWRLVLVFGPPLILLGPMVTMLLVVGLLGRTFQDARREWLSRLAAVMGLLIMVWVLFFGISLFGYAVVMVLARRVWAALPVFVTWITASVGGLLAGKSAKSSGTKSDEGPRFGVTEAVAMVGPYIFIAGLLVLISALAELVLHKAGSYGAVALVVSYLAPLLICLLFGWRVDINEFSLHAFYRNRLARCYLGASNIPRHPNPFTGFDEADANVAVSDLLPRKGYDGPFPIFCTALNLTFGEDLAWQERKAASFAITPLYSGYDVPWTAARGDTNLRFNGFVETATYAYPSPGIHLNTAVAISGAALSPNMGYHSSLLRLFC